MTSVIKHRLRATAGMFGSYRPEGWNPRLRVPLVGPTPAGAELVWCVCRPDGSSWFEHRMPVPELSSGEVTTADLQHWVDGVDIAEPGTCAFTLRIVSALDGVDELLHDGSLRVVALDGVERYAVDDEWMLGLALIGLDTVDEPDAPPLAATVFIDGQVEAHEFEAHCFRNGSRLAGAARVESRHTFTANDGAVLGQELCAVFDDVRGWNNLSGSGWGAGWHLLDAVQPDASYDAQHDAQHDAQYDVRFVRGQAVVRSVTFEVSNGRLSAPGVIEADPASGPVLFFDAARPGPPVEPAALRDPVPAFYGDPVTAAAWLTLDDVYALRVDRPAGGSAAEGSTTLDDDTAAALQAYFDRAERLIDTWEDDLVETAGPFDMGQVLAAEAVIREEPSYRQLLDAAAAVPDDHAMELNGSPVTVGELRSRLQAIFTSAEARIGTAGQAEDDALAPFRALLNGARLAVFDEHPADAFLYLTVNRRVIETPEELAAAEYWFFEGPVETAVTATVDGVRVTGSVGGWRVLGWQFDADGAILDEFETQGQGQSAPKSAFQPRA